MVDHLLAGILISSLLITLKQNRWKLPLLSQTEHGSTYSCLGTESWLSSQNFTQAQLGEFSILEEVFFVSFVLNSVLNTTVICKLNCPSLLIHRDHFNDLLIHQREAVGRLAQLSATRTPVRVKESRLSNLCVDLRLETPADRQSMVVANACAARLFHHIVRSQWHGRSLKLIQHQHLLYVWGSSVGVAEQYIGWLDGKERKEHTKSMQSSPWTILTNSQTRKSQILPQASPVAACLRPEHTNCFRFLPLRCLKL